MLTWNRKAFLETLFSDFYKKIDNKNYNFFIIDNGSTDGTQEFLKELATKDSKIHITFNITNKGFGPGEEVNDFYKY